MKISEIRIMESEVIRNKLSDTRQEYMNLRFQIATGQQTDTSRLRVMRETIAQFQTILRERELNINQNIVSKKPVKPSSKEPKPEKSETKVSKETKQSEAKKTTSKTSKAATTTKKTAKTAKTGSKNVKEGDK